MVSFLMRSYIDKQKRVCDDIFLREVFGRGAKKPEKSEIVVDRASISVFRGFRGGFCGVRCYWGVEN